MHEHASNNIPLARQSFPPARFMKACFTMACFAERFCALVAALAFIKKAARPIAANGAANKIVSLFLHGFVLKNKSVYD